MLTDRLHAKGTPAPIIDDYNRLATALGAPNTDHQMELLTTPADEAAAESVFARFGLHRYSRVVLLNPGAAFGAAKHWPTEYFAQLARALTAKHGCAALVLCGPAEREIARAIAEGSRSPNVFALADSALSLGLTKALVKRCDLLVTTDSGPRHFAAAFGRPVVALFGPTHVEWTETYFAKEIQLQVKLPCGPCQQRACPLGHHRCMRELTPERALAACERLLRGEVRRVA
jgi:heptosyltransferase-2